jgi:RNA polymerase sigma-70 factor (ECF subfamily)
MAPVQHVAEAASALDREAAVSSIDMSADRDRTFEHWLERYRPAFQRFFRRRGCEDALGADLTQDTLVQIWRSRCGFRGESEATFRAWAFRVAETVWLKHWRPHRPPLDPLSDELESPSADPQASAADEQRSAALRAGIERLPPQMQRVVLLYCMDRTEQEIAALLGMSVNTVKAHMHQARHKLAHHLEARSTAHTADRSSESPDESQ